MSEIWQDVLHSSTLTSARRFCLPPARGGFQAQLAGLCTENFLHSRRPGSRWDLIQSSTVRAGSVAVAGHALDCAECAGMRRMRWKCAGMRWNALECAVCAELRQVRRIAPIAPIAPNCAVCADCALFAPNCADCAGIALEFCLQPGTRPYTHGWRSLVATSLLAACSFRAVPVVPGFCGSLYSTSSRSPAIFLQLSVMQRDTQCRSKTKCVVIASHSASFFGERPRISPQLTCS